MAFKSTFFEFIIILLHSLWFSIPIFLFGFILHENNISLAETLENKAESGQGNSRLERRMKRKQQREIAEITEKLLSNPPPIPSLPSELPPIDALVELPTLPAIPPIGDGGLPPLGELPPPIAGIPTPQREVSCTECSAKFTVKDMMLTKVNCPICSEVVNL